MLDTYVVGWDLSFRSCGVSIFRIGSGGKVTFIDSYAVDLLKDLHDSYLDKKIDWWCAFKGLDSAMHGVLEHVDQGRTIFAVEYPILAGDSTAQQAALNQYFLMTAWHMNICVASVSVMGLKKFIRGVASTHPQFVDDPKTFNRGKGQIKTAYNDYIYPLLGQEHPETFPSPDLLKNSDMRDAYFVGLLYSCLLLFPGTRLNHSKFFLA